MWFRMFVILGFFINLWAFRTPHSAQHFFDYGVYDRPLHFTALMMCVAYTLDWMLNKRV